MNPQLRDRHIEIVTREGASTIVDAVEARPHTGRDLTERAQDRDDALIAPVDQSLKKGLIVAADVEADPRVTLDLSLPSFVDRNDRSRTVDEGNLLNETVDHLLDFVEGEACPLSSARCCRELNKACVDPICTCAPRRRLT